MDRMRGWLGGAEPIGGGEAAREPQRVEFRPVPAKSRPRALPAFRGLVSRPRLQGQGQARLERARGQLREAFTPTQPVTEARVFAGRTKLLQQLIDSIEHRMSHVVLFGERGIGKTSVLHILGKLAEESDYVVLRATCGTRTEFSALFRTVLRHVPIRFHESVSPTLERSEHGQTLADLLPAGPFDARELSEVLSGVTSTRLLILLDEYDRIDDESFRQAIAELIKNLSDLAARVHLVIAGVSSNLDELIGYIPSIRRNIVGLPVQRLSDEEVRELLGIGEEASGLRFRSEASAAILTLGNGSPYLVRLIAYHSSLIALDAGRLEVSEADVAQGLDRMVEETESRLPVPVAARARQVDVVAHPAMLAEVARLGGTPNGWFDVPTPLGANIARLFDRLMELGLLERRQGPDGDLLHFVDEGLATYFWMLASRANLRAGQPARATSG